MKVLVSGFEPFGGELRNPAWEAVKGVSNQIGDSVVKKIKLPVAYEESGDILISEIKRENPDIVICVGQAGGRCGLTPEFVALNWKDASIEDNTGSKSSGERIKEDGQDAYFTNLPVKAMVKVLKEKGVPASLSYTAGTYVCNSLMYRLLYYINKECKNIKGGFIHVPFDTIQAASKERAVPSLPIEMMAKGLEYCIEAALLYANDISIAMGRDN